MILGTEINEFVTNRQLSKIHFLQQENNQLQEYILDLENALKLNKQAMQITLESTGNNQSQSTTLSYNGQDTKQYLQKQELLLLRLNEENSRLIQMLSKVHKETSNITTKSLLQEQIHEENINFYKDLIVDLEDKIIELKRNIHDKEYTIQELERTKPIMLREGQLILQVDIMAPSEQNLKMNDEIQRLQRLISQLSQKSQDIFEQNKILKDINYNLKREVYKLRIVLCSQVAHHIMKDFVYNDYIDNTDQNLELNYQIQQHRPQLEQLHFEVEGMAEQGFKSESQHLKFLSKNERIKSQEKLHRMEMMLKGFKELFEKEKTTNEINNTRFNEIVNRLNDLTQINEILIQSNQQKDHRINKIIANLQFHQNQSHYYMELLKSRKSNFQGITLQQDLANLSPRKTDELLISVRKLSLPPQDQRQQDLKQKELSDLRGEQINNLRGDQIKDLTKQTQPQQNNRGNVPETARIQNIDIQYAQTYRNVRPKLKPNDFYQMGLEECREFLVNMAQEFDLSYRYQFSNMKKIALMNQINGVVRPRQLRRSNSDPFGYFSKEIEEEKIVFRQPNKLPNNKNEIQMMLEEIKTRKKLDTPGKPQDPFDLDMSYIMGRKPLNKTEMPPVSSKRNVVIDTDLSFISNQDEEIDQRDLTPMNSD